MTALRAASLTMTLGLLLTDEKEDEHVLTLADGLEGAFIGVGQQFNTTFAVYDMEKVELIFMGRGMSLEEAREWIEYNVTGAYVGPKTPVFVRRQTLEEALEALGDDRG